MAKKVVSDDKERALVESTLPVDKRPAAPAEPTPVAAGKVQQTVAEPTPVVAGKVQQTVAEPTPPTDEDKIGMAEANQSRIPTRNRWRPMAANE